MPKPNRVQIIRYERRRRVAVFGKSSPRGVLYRADKLCALWKKRNSFSASREWTEGATSTSSENPRRQDQTAGTFLRQDISYGHGLCLIDPHGDVIDAILDYIPKERIEDVCIISPPDLEFPLRSIRSPMWTQCSSFS